MLKTKEITLDVNNFFRGKRLNKRARMDNFLDKRLYAMVRL